MKYPKGVTINSKSAINYGNRGMNFEADINVTNDYYLNNDIAVIYKKPTPITINKVDYHSRIDAVIKEAHFKIPSTTDYNGIYKGKYIDFEAKECTSTTSFPLKNIKEYQLNHLTKVNDFQGIGFIIFYFTKIEKFYLLYINEINDYIKNNSKRSSIPLTYFKEKNHEITLNLNFRIDYLKEIDKIIS